MTSRQKPGLTHELFTFFYYKSQLLFDNSFKLIKTQNDKILNQRMIKKRTIDSDKS